MAAPPGADAGAAAVAADVAGYALRPVWQQNDPQVIADAVGFWRRLGILPASVDPEARARELAAVAYKGGQLVGVATVAPARLEVLRGRFAFLRSAIDPEHRRARLAMALAILTRDTIEAWSAEHPEEKLLGLAAIIESPDLVARQREPVWPTTRLNLVGFTPQGRQVRVAWFAHARMD